METPDPPNDTPGASKQVVLTPHDIPRILRVVFCCRCYVCFFTCLVDGNINYNPLKQKKVFPNNALLLVGNMDHPKLGTIFLIVFDFQGHHNM